MDREEIEDVIEALEYADAMLVEFPATWRRVRRALDIMRRAQRKAIEG